MRIVDLPLPRTAVSGESPFRLLVGAWLAAAVTISRRFRGSADRSGGKVSRAAEGPAMRAALGTAGAGLWLSMLAYVVRPALIARTQLPLRRPLRYAGAALAHGCLPLVQAIFGALGANVTRTVVTRERHTLVTHGPYRFVRHPLYTVGTVAVAGLGLASASWLIAAHGIVAFALLARRTRQEEAALVERFGDDYRAYARRTGRFLPRPWATTCRHPPNGG